MTSTGDDQNPYQAPVAVSPPALSERRQRSLTILEVAIGCVLAIVVGGITFYATCGSLGFLVSTSFGGTPFRLNRWRRLAIGACWVIGIIAGVAATSFTAVRWNRWRKD